MSLTKKLNNYLKATLNQATSKLTVPYDEDIKNQIFINYPEAELYSDDEIWFETKSGHNFEFIFTNDNMTFEMMYDTNEIYYDDEPDSVKLTKAERYGADDEGMVYLGSGISIPLDEVWW